MNKEFRGILGARPVTPDQLSKVQANETLTLPGSRETQSEVGQSILDPVRFGLPDDYCETYAGKVRALKVNDLEDAAKTVIHSDNLTCAIGGDSSNIASGVKELNLGELHLISREGQRL